MSQSNLPYKEIECAIEQVMEGAEEVMLRLTGNKEADEVISKLNKLFNTFSRQKRSLSEGSIFKELFERSGDAVSIIENGMFTDSNLSAMKRFGYSTKAEILNVHPSALSPKFQPDGRLSREKADDIMNTALAQGSLRFEWIHQLASGEVFPAEIVLTTLVNEPARKVFHSVMRDITVQKKNQQDLEHAYKKIKELKQEMELILQSTGEGIYRLDQAGAITFANNAALKMLERDADEAIGRSVHQLFHPAKNGQATCALCTAVSSGKPLSSDDAILRKKSGDTFPVEYISVPIKSEHGEIKGAVISFLDITDRKLAEKNLKYSNEKLKAALNEVQLLKERLESENDYLQEEIKLNHNFQEIISKSKQFKKVLKDIEQVARTDATVLIEGESGTGKELVARAIHNLSNRKSKALVKVNCAALPANLIESELFGHVKGAFTGAIGDKTGRFELAHKGTIFLDEIGELPLELQAKLLRVLQEGEFDRLGSSKTLQVDVRIIAATNVKLKEAVGKGKFREDLYYRLNVFPLSIPPLRERKEDVSLLAQHFLMKFNLKFNKSIEGLSRHTLQQLTAYDWPGNVRELENIIERAVITSNGKTLDLRRSLDLNQESAVDEILDLTEIERNHIRKVLDKTNWRIGGDEGAAALLGLNRTTLLARMKKLEITR